MEGGETSGLSLALLSAIMAATGSAAEMPVAPEARHTTLGFRIGS